MSAKCNAKGMYRVYGFGTHVGIATKQNLDEELNEMTVMNVRLFDGTVLELLAGDLKFDSQW